MAQPDLPASIHSKPGAAHLASMEALARLTFLAEASRLLSNSNDHEGALVEVARLAASFLGAWCVVDLVDASGAVRRIAVAHRDPEKQEATRELLLRPPEAIDALGAQRIFRAPRPEVVKERIADLDQALHDPAELALLRQLGGETFVTMPLVARDRLVGTMTFGSHSGADFGALDLATAEDLGRRCARAIDAGRFAEDTAAAREAEKAAYLVAKAVALQTAEINERLLLASLRGQELADEAAFANRAKSEFLSTMSHEIRTPINAIVGYTELLTLEVEGPLTDGQKGYIERIKRSTDHLMLLINDILDLAKVEAGRMVMTLEPASAIEAICAAVDLLRTQADTAGIQLVHPTLDGDSPSYIGDERRVKQILVNLLSNAVKFTNPGGRVSVTTGVTTSPDPEALLGDENSWTFIRVEDTGIGIAADEMVKVFMPFVQAEMGPSRPYEGTGLGLTIAHEMALRMNGELTLRSELGVGSTFTLWLPGGP